MSQTKAQLIDGKSAEIEFTGGSASAPAISFTGDTNTGIYSPGADQVAVATNGTGQLFISSLGNIGIGAASPSAWSYGGNIAMLGTGRYIASTSDDIRFASNVYTSDVERYAANGFATRYRMSDGTHQWATAVTGTANNAITYNESMRITAAGLVGIGSSTPGSYNAFADDLVIANGSGNPGITLAGSATGWGSIYFADGITGSEPYRGYIQYSHTNDRMTFATGGGLAAMHIDSSQRVGIGTTSPITTQGGLDVSSGGISLVIGADTPHYTNAEEPFGLLFGISDSSTNELYIGGGTTAINAATDIRFHTAANNTTTSGSERARIDSSGRLLVGTSTSTSATVNGLVGKTQIASSENAALALHGHSSTALYGADIVFTRSRSATIGTNTIVQNGDEFGRIYFTGANGTGFDYGASIQAVVDGTPGVGDMPGRLVFSTTADGASTPTERMRITNAGKVLIGTSTSANTVVFAVQSDVAGSAGGNYPLATIESTGTSDSGAACLHLGKKANDTSTSNVFQRFYINSSGTGSGQINANGASAAAFGSFSDERLKENIVDLPPQLQNICDLRPVEFDYKDGSGHQIGFIAQEMQEVYPDVIGETEGTLTVTGWSKTEARLVKALQEAIGRIETLEGMVAVNNITIDEQQHQLSTLAARLTALESA
jgi:uncharacterized coiled-coil protein SlyX